MKNPCPDILLYIAMADAYAMGAEYIKLPEHQEVQDQLLKFETYVNNPHHPVGIGLYTDDTEMSIANSLVLIKNKGVMHLDFADAYVEEFNFGGRRLGYSKGLQAILESVSSGRELRQKLVPNSDKNGAAMRAIPFGYSSDLKYALEATAMSASITHHTTIGMFSARAMTLASHFSVWTNDPFDRLREYVLDNLERTDLRYFYPVVTETWDGSRVVGTDKWSVGLTTVNAVLTLVTQEKSLMGLLKKTIEWGGDTDSVAALAWGIAAPRFQGEKLPEFLERDLERGNFKTGPDRLREIGKQLNDWGRK